MGSGSSAAMAAATATTTATTTTATRLLEVVPDRHRDTAPAPAPAVLHGRDRELEVVGGLLDRARDGHGGALAVLAGPGLGKTSLLEAAAGQARPGFRTLHARGVRREGAVPYAGLHRLLHPVSGAIARLPEALAGALAPLAGGAAREVTGDGPDGAAPFMLYAAVCALLSETAADGPVLCLVDDAHLLDRVSLEALAFAARRLSGVPVAMLFAARPGPPVSPVVECLADIPPLRPAPLDESAGLRVLEALTRGALDEEAAAGIAELAAGNPLALVELAAALTPDQLSGTAPPPRALPPRSALRSHYRRRYLRLTAGARRLVLMAAADDRLDLNTLARAAGEDGIDLRELEWARASGLILVDGDRVETPSALVRSSLYADASPAERRSVHELLARALDRGGHAPRRSWHRAALAEEPDDALAAELARAAETLQNGGEHEEASRTWERSAVLTAASGIRADRYIAAARQAWHAGRTRRARAMLRQVRPCTSDPGRIGRADMLQGEIEMCDGLPVMALWILQEAADRLAGVDPALALEALLKASAAADTTGDHHCYRGITERAIALPAAPAGTAAPVMELFRDYFTGLKDAAKHRRGEAERRLRRVLRAAEAIDEPAVRSWARWCGRAR
ncbi:AAA family ATPase [Spirillospora sp. CA-255316]